MWWLELARDLIHATLRAHTPDTARMMCPACLAHGFVEIWPCDEAVRAANALDLLDTLTATPTQPADDGSAHTTIGANTGTFTAATVDEVSCRCEHCVPVDLDDTYAPPLWRTCSSPPWPPGPHSARTRLRHRRRHRHANTPGKPTGGTT